MNLTLRAQIWENMLSVTGFQMRILPTMAFLMMSPLVQAVEWSIEQCSALDLLAGRTGVADTRPSNDPHHNSAQMMEQNSGIYRGQWSWQSEMPELLYEIMHTGEADKVSPSGFTALHAACVYADETLFRALMSAGVPIDTRAGDWQQLGYVGDTPLGLLVRFMSPRTAAARVRMARVLLEKGANPDAPMTTWRGDRMVTTVPFCEMGSQPCNHEMRMLLLQFGESDLKSRMNGWTLSWDSYNSELKSHLQRGGVTAQITSSSPVVRISQDIGQIPLLDLIRKGDVEGVRMALESGVSIEVSQRARRYGQEPLFNIPARKKDDPEAGVEIARMLVEAGADVNELNRRGKSLRIHYDKFYSKTSRALCAYFKSCGSLIHPDSPDRRAEVEQSRLDAQARAAARAARLAARHEPAAEEEVPVAADPAPAPAETAPVAADPAPAPAEEAPVATDPAPAPAETAPVATDPAPAPAEEAPVATDPAPAPAEEAPVAAEPAPAPAEEAPVAADPAPAPAEEAPVATDPAPAPVVDAPVVAEPAPAPAEEASMTATPAVAPKETPQEASARLMLEVQAQLAELQARYEAELQKQEETQKKKAADAPAE